MPAKIWKPNVKKVGIEKLEVIDLVARSSKVRNSGHP
jgi:hypothetical protein